jgi:hypothetical protein
VRMEGSLSATAAVATLMVEEGEGRGKEVEVGEKVVVLGEKEKLVGEKEERVGEELG